MFKGTVVDTIIKILVTLALAGIILAVLPASPFSSVIETIGALPYLGYLNWFFPVGRCLSVMTVWLVAVGIYYGVSWIFRQLGIIGS